MATSSAVVGSTTRLSAFQMRLHMFTQGRWRGQQPCMQLYPCGGSHHTGLNQATTPEGTVSTAAFCIHARRMESLGTSAIALNFAHCPKPTIDTLAQEGPVPACVAGGGPHRGHFVAMPSTTIPQLRPHHTGADESQCFWRLWVKLPIATGAAPTHCIDISSGTTVLPGVAHGGSLLGTHALFSFSSCSPICEPQR